ncbi:TadE/TadG family type IV pilus assembly protein [Streptomyces sp. NPDC002073]
MTGNPLRAWVQRRAAGARSDRGSESIAAAIVTPLLLILLCTAIAGGRMVTSGAKIDAAAEDAARAASISRTNGDAQAQAAAAAARSLNGQGIQCASSSTSVDTSGLAAPLGQVGTVTVTISCTVPMSDLLLPGVPGSKTLTSRFTSVVDAYRSRALGFTNPEGPWNASRRMGAVQ